MTSVTIRNALLTWPRATLTGMPLTLPRVVVVLLAAAPTGLAGSAAPTGLAGPGRLARGRTSVRRPARRIPPRSHRRRRYGPVRRPAPWCRSGPKDPKGRNGRGGRPADG